MNILLINTSEKIGGAAVAANRLMYALNKNGVQAKMLVRDKQTDDENVVTIPQTWRKKGYFLWERLVIWSHLRFSKKSLFAIDIANVGFDITQLPAFQEADIIHLHWINQGFLSLRSINKIMTSGKPVVWTMHDMWPFTGICHHAHNCKGYQKYCGNCPLLPHGGSPNDLSHRILVNKKFLSTSSLSIVSVSNWLNSKVSESTVFKSLNLYMIPNVVDTVLFTPKEKSLVREKLKLPQDKKILLMGAAKLNDPIKGFAYLCDALCKLQHSNDFLLILFGEVKKDPSFLGNIPVKTLFLGTINQQDVLADLYASADVTVVSSLYETFGQTLTESMACATPTVSFNNSGQTDIIDHKTNGYLAQYKNAEDLAKGIQWVLYEADYEALCANARKKVVENYSEQTVSKKYIELYNEIITNKK